jgi:hypothetical protein
MGVEQGRDVPASCPRDVVRTGERARQDWGETRGQGRGRDGLLQLAPDSSADNPGEPRSSAIRCECPTCLLFSVGLGRRTLGTIRCNARASHWQRWSGRSSPLTGNPRLAGDPINCLLNVTYGLVYSEARIACLAVGIDPAIGWLHTDVRSRDSAALDLMETCRPDADAFVLDLLERRVLRRTDFHETKRGVIRLMPPLLHEIAATSLTWASIMAPVAEEIVNRLSISDPRMDDIPTPLTQRNRSTGRDGIRKGTVGNAMSGHALGSVAASNVGSRRSEQGATATAADRTHRLPGIRFRGAGQGSSRRSGSCTRRRGCPDSW